MPAGNPFAAAVAIMPEMKMFSSTCPAVKCSACFPSGKHAELNIQMIWHSAVRCVRWPRR
jgi:hypothetical protein